VSIPSYDRPAKWSSTDDAVDATELTEIDRLGERRKDLVAYRNRLLDDTKRIAARQEQLDAEQQMLTRVQREITEWRVSIDQLIGDVEEEKSDR
jgi:hypothetical protein